MSKLSIVGALIGILVIGCTSVEPLEPPLKDGIPPGPGLFTGSKGEWIIAPGAASTVIPITRNN